MDLSVCFVFEGRCSFDLNREIHKNTVSSFQCANLTSVEQL
jgi:hypothetical protein